MKEKEIKKDRQNTTGVSGSPKKGGAGGKGVWGTYKNDLQENPKEDDHDPNYNSEDDEEAVIKKTEGVHPFVALLEEYIMSGDADEARKSLQELNVTNYDYFVKKSIIMGIENKAYERELISKLLSNFYNGVLSSEIIMEGLQLILNSLDDLKLDNPDVVDVVSKYIARAIVDEIIPPIFLNKAKVENNNLANESIAIANGLVNEKHRLDRLQHVWGPGDLSSVKRLKEEVQLLIEEFIVNEDYQEADRSLRKLGAPSFHFQLVKQALRIAFTKTEQERNKIVKLLQFLNKEGLITTDQMERGFKVSFAGLKDLQLDIPNAGSLFTQMVDTAKQQGFLQQDVNFN